MFCHKCGKEVPENSLFCTWCGTKQEVPPSSVPIPTETPKSDLEAAPLQPGTSVPLPEEPVTAGGSQPDQPDPAPAPQAPQPEQPQQSAGSINPGIEVPLNVPAPEKKQKYYTSAHLAICLVTAGVMAAAAGVFAGLYFSVIL